MATNVINQINIDGVLYYIGLEDSVAEDIIKRGRQAQFVIATSNATTPKDVS